MEEANIALKIELNKDDFDGLIQILSVLNTINEKQYIYDFMFEPLKEIVDLLKTYNYEFKEEELTMVRGRYLKFVYFLLIGFLPAKRASRQMVKGEETSGLRKTDYSPDSVLSGGSYREANNAVRQYDFNLPQEVS